MEREPKRQRTSYEASEPEMNIQELPCEIFVLILSFLDGSSLVLCSGVCVSWNRLISNQDYLFKHHCQQKLGKEDLSLPGTTASWKSYYLSLRNDQFLNLILDALDSAVTTDVTTTPFETHFPEPNQRQRNTVDFIRRGLKVAEEDKDFQLQVLKSARNLYLDSPEVHNSFFTKLDGDDAFDDEEGLLSPSDFLSIARKYCKKDNFYMGAVYVRIAAKWGIPVAQNTLGIYHTNGIGVEINPKEAARWYKAAADQGYINGQYNLAICYIEGEGVKQDVKEGMKLMTQLAEDGDVSAQGFLTSSYVNGDVVEQDYNEAVKWATLAANAGHATSQYILGRCYMAGSGVEKDTNEALRWWTAAAENDNDLAQFELGFNYLHGTVVEKNYKEAIRLLTLSAEKGHRCAQLMLGMCFLGGDGVQKDLSEAVKWIKLSAANGSSPAQAVLGNLILAGCGVEKDDKEAVKWPSVAAEKGESWAQYALSNCYVSGSGVERNIREALRWLAMATEKGHFAEVWKSKGYERAHVIELMLEDEEELQAFLDKGGKEKEASNEKEASQAKEDMEAVL